MTTIINPADRSKSLPTSNSLFSSIFLASVLYVGGCSLNYDYLGDGQPSQSDAGVASTGTGGASAGGATGGSKGQTGGSGGKSSSTGTAGTMAVAGGSQGTGGLSCTAGATLCSGDTTCTDLSTGKTSGSTVKNCGACGSTCDVTHASSATCSGGKCVIASSSCSSGYLDCNSSSANDGCEASISAVTTCGGCSHSCSTNNVASGACTATTIPPMGTIYVCRPTCYTGYKDCNADNGGGSTDDGCDTNLNALNTCGTLCATVACSPTQVCNAGSCGAPRGMVKLSIPYAPYTAADAGTQNQDQRFAYVFPVTPDFTNVTLAIRLYAPGATNGHLQVYLTDTANCAGGGGSFEFSAMSGGWSDINIPIGTPTTCAASPTGNYDPTHLKQLTLEFLADGTGPWANPTLIYIDKIFASNTAVLNATFDTTAGQITKSTQAIVPGSTFTWVDTLP